jgi:UDP-3-O-[3-hydroxymyristoyl] glucosamine N-acyltransferase
MAGKVLAMKFKASQIAALIQSRIEGNPDAEVVSFGKIEEAGPGQLSFLANPKYEEFLYTTQASAVIVGENLQLKQSVQPTLLRVADPYSAFATLLQQYQRMMQEQLIGRQEPSYVDNTAKLGNEIFIGAFAYIGKNVVLGDRVKIYPQVYIGDDVQIGDDTILYPGVKVYHGCKLGKKVVIHGGTVVGSDGFGFAPQPDGTLKKVPQIGIVVIEDGVEIGANTTIDRATIGQTTIKSGAKIDNLVQLAHNVEVGNSTVIAAQTGISGSTKVGNGVMIGGQVGIVGHIQIGDGAKINAQSGVSKSLEPGKVVTGSPAYDYTQSLRSQAITRRLPELEKRIIELEKQLAELKPMEANLGT